MKHAVLPLAHMSERCNDCGVIWHVAYLIKCTSSCCGSCHGRSTVLNNQTRQARSSLLEQHVNDSSSTAPFTRYNQTTHGTKHRCSCAHVAVLKHAAAVMAKGDAVVRVQHKMLDTSWFTVTQ